VNIGKNITRLREQRGLTIRDLSFKTNIAENSLSSIEHGKKGVGLLTLIKLADALNCSLDYLCGRSTISTVQLQQSSQDDPDDQNGQDEQSADKARFLAIMSNLYDKYFKLPTPSTPAFPAAETIDANDSVDVHSDKSAGKEMVERVAAVKTLNNVIKAGIPWKESLWTCVRLWQGEEFRTAGRGKMHSGSTAFTYELKKSSRTGEETGELIISGRNGKTVTRSSVELAFTNALKEMSECGYVKGPKKLGQIFGGSYLYAMFIAWGVISSSPDGSTESAE